MERRNGEFLGHFQQADVVGDGTDHHDGFVRGGDFLARAARGEHAEAAEGEGGTVGAGHEEAAEDDFVEVRVGFACGVVSEELHERAAGGTSKWKVGGMGESRLDGTYELGSGRA